MSEVFALRFVNFIRRVYHLYAVFIYNRIYVFSFARIFTPWP